MQRAPHLAKILLTGWGRYPSVETMLFEPKSVAEMISYIVSEANATFIGRGLGRSYGDAAINGSGLTVSDRKIILEGISLAESSLRPSRIKGVRIIGES